MLPLIPVAGLAIVGLVILWRQSNRHRAGLFLLSALPLALLFLVVPLPFVAVQTINAFKQVSESGQGSVHSAAALALITAQPLWPAALGCLIVLGATAVLRVLLGRNATPSDDAVAGKSAISPVWATRIIVGASILALPVCLLFARTGGIPALIMEAGLTLTQGAVDPAPLIAGMTVQEFSTHISFRFILAAGAGTILIPITLACMALNLYANRFAESFPTLERYSWVVFAAVAITAAWNLVSLAVSIPTFRNAMG